MHAYNPNFLKIEILKPLLTFPFPLNIKFSCIHIEKCQKSISVRERGSEWRLYCLRRSIKEEYYYSWADRQMHYNKGEGKEVHTLYIKRYKAFHYFCLLIRYIHTCMIKSIVSYRMSLSFHNWNPICKLKNLDLFITLNF